jgi:hypothetical protein
LQQLVGDLATATAVAPLATVTNMTVLVVPGVSRAPTETAAVTTVSAVAPMAIAVAVVTLAPTNIMTVLPVPSASGAPIAGTAVATVAVVYVWANLAPMTPVTALAAPCDPTPSVIVAIVVTAAVVTL